MYDEQISSSQVPSQLGDLKPEDLSGPEALLNPGKNTVNNHALSIFFCHYERAGAFRGILLLNLRMFCEFR